MQMPRFIQTSKLPDVDSSQSHNAAGFLTWGGGGEHPFEASMIKRQYDKGGPRFQQLNVPAVALGITSPSGDNIAFVNSFVSDDDETVVKHALKAVCGAGAQLGELARTAAGAHGKHLLLLADKVFSNMCDADPDYSTTDLQIENGNVVSCVVEWQGHKRWVIMVCSSKRGLYPCMRKIAATNLTVGVNKKKKCNSTLLIELELDDVVTGVGLQGGGPRLLAQPPASQPRAFIAAHQPVHPNQPAHPMAVAAPAFVPAAQLPAAAHQPAHPMAVAAPAAPPLAAGPSARLKRRRMMQKAYNGICPNGVTVRLFPGVHDLTGDD